MLEINIQTPLGEPYQMEWENNAKEFSRLWADCEEEAASQASDPKDIAAAVLHDIVTGPAGMNKRQAVWVVFAVLLFAENSIDFTKLTDEGAVEPTIFDLAEHQTIKATIRSVVADEMKITIDVLGTSHAWGLRGVRVLGE